MVRSRLDTELVGNVSIRVVDIGRPDAWEVQGRGELALAVLVEQMRREGFELTVGKPQVVTRTIGGRLHEPFEALTIDCPEEFVGAITQLMAARKGRMVEMANHAAGWVRMDFLVPSRGLIGFLMDSSPRRGAPGSRTRCSRATTRGPATSSPVTPARWCPTGRAR